MQIGRILVLAGLLLMFAGAIVLLLGKLGLPPGRLPGDLTYRRRNFAVYLPLGTSLLLSVLLSLVFYLLARFHR